MKVRDLIARLQEMDPELPVAGYREEESGLGCFYERLVITDIGVEASPEAEYRGFRDKPGQDWTVYRGPHLRIG